jgi:hypothetical protein
VAAFDTVTYKLERTYGTSQGVDGPRGLVEDTSGNLYVTNTNGNNVIEFAAGKTTVLKTLTEAIASPFALAFDPSGNLYVLNYGATGGPNVTVYSASGSKLRVITKGISDPAALALDSHGNLYVANRGTNDVTVYDGGGKALSQTINTGYPNNVSVDRSDDLYVVACGKKCIDARIIEYSPGGKAILRTITKELRDARAVALDSKGNLFAAQADAGDVKTPCRVPAYAPGKTQPYETITDAVHGSTGVAFDASDQLYVLNSINHCSGSRNGDVTVYPAGKTTYIHKFTKPIVYPSAMIIGS